MRKQALKFHLTKFEIALWLSSVAVMLLGYILVPENGLLKLIASLIGVTALIFVAKGHVLGQVLVIIFSTFYGYISFHFAYYGEMITYVFMSAPMAVIALISWIKHPFPESAEVEIRRLSAKGWGLLALITVAVTVAFYFILDALGTANLIPSTLSVATSFFAAALTFLRSPYYALGYAANDIVLIVLWVLAAKEEPSYLVMVVCFLMFLINDLYGFFNWRKMQKRQESIS